MKAIIKPEAAPGFSLRNDQPTPTAAPSDVVIRTLKSGICGTDLHIVDWDTWSASRIKPPLIFGHEFCGVVESVGEAVTRVQPGDFVTAEMHLPCGDCSACRSDKPHICQSLQIAGVDRNGCYAEFVALPETQIIPLPQSISIETAACLDAVGNAVHTTTKEPVAGKTVLVTGCGPIGLFAIAAARALGAKAVYASDVQPYRLELANRLKADGSFNAMDLDVVAACREATYGDGIDVVLEMSGQPRAIDSGLEVLKPGGAIVMLGIPPRPVTIDLPKHVLFKETRMIGVTGREMFRTWDVMLDLLTSGKLDVSPVITHEYPLENFGEAIELMKSGETGKVLLQVSS